MAAGFGYDAHPIVSFARLIVNTDWRSFLTGIGAVLSEDTVAHFGDPQAERRAAATGNIIVDLSHLSLIAARGPDTEAFLNSQFSNDIRLLDHVHSQLNAYCNAKGRMFAILRVFRRANDYLLQLPAPMRDDLIKRLRMFVLRAQVTLALADDELQRLGLVGPDTAELIERHIGTVPTADDGCLTQGEFTVLKIPGAQPRFEIVAPTAAAIRFWSGVKTSCLPAGVPTWHWHDIRAGIPIVLPPTSAAFVPQMMNLEALGGISFTKGCYPGQEIVARMHYLGRPKQRMYLAHAGVATPPPRAGDPIFAPDFPGQPAGTVADTELSPMGGYDLLAVVQISSAETGILHLHTEDGPPLILQSSG